jgi:hypothetical protein
VTTLARLLGGVLLVASLLVGSLALSAGPASASCAEPSADFADSSDLVFSGVVRDRGGGEEAPVVTVRVDRAFKGEVTRRVDVVSDGPNPSYEIDARAGDEVLVFARLRDGEVTSDLCSFVTGPYVARVLRDLGEGAAPSPGHTQVEQEGLTRDQWRTGRLVLGVVGLTFLAFLAYRALRGRLGRRGER